MLITLEDIEQWVGMPLPPRYRALLPRFTETVIGDDVLLCPLSYVIERNTTFESKKYCPGHLAIGDKSGGGAFAIWLAHQGSPR